MVWKCQIEKVKEMYLEEPTKFQGIASTFDKFDDRNTLIIISQDSNFALKRASTFINVINRDSNISRFIDYIFQRRGKDTLRLQSFNQYSQQLVRWQERVKLSHPIRRTQVFEP